jgi:predicted nuclease of restriction endonuclease-like (RecB) superfamily
MTDSLFQGPPQYESFLQEPKNRIRSAQVRAALSVNRELILLYWSIGRDILNRQNNEGWGAKVIDRLSVDLSKAFPEMHGFRPRNLKYMRAFAEAYPDQEFVQQVVAQLPWGTKSEFWTPLRMQHKRNGTSGKRCQAVGVETFLSIR